MQRRILAVIMLVLAALLVIVSVVAFTPLGARVFPFLAQAPTATPVPVLTSRGTPPTVSARSAYLLDADTGNMLVNINGQQRLPMASTTKIMTAIITLEQGNLDQLVTVSQDAVDEARLHNGSNAQLVVGDQIRLKDLLYGLMLPSGDDAAIAIAKAVGGSVPAFVQRMNRYAQRLHLTQTHYSNPDGLTYLTPQGKPDPNLYTSAGDLARLARYAMANALFAQIVQLQHYVLPATAHHHAYTWDNIDTLLSTYPGATGIKTGYTPEAGYCLVFSATDTHHRIIGVLLHEPGVAQRFADASTLLDWGFALPVLPPPTPRTS
ncbi:MAG: D-alanyl-D-alanine carboxypeptidase [Ktedonobacteraceae bacterium]|nr:D-alanyl-D-alanine carboxypeptidase [Ktedonobacteraceae bacterium]